MNPGEKPLGWPPPGEPPTNFTIPDPSLGPLPGFCMAERVQQTPFFCATQNGISAFV